MMCTTRLITLHDQDNSLWEAKSDSKFHPSFLWIGEFDIHRCGKELPLSEAIFLSASDLAIELNSEELSGRPRRVKAFPFKSYAILVFCRLVDRRRRHRNLRISCLIGLEAELRVLQRLSRIELEEVLDTSANIIASRWSHDVFPEAPLLWFRD